MRGSTSAWRSSARSSMKRPALPLAFPAQRSPSHLPTRTKLKPSEIDIVVIASPDVPEQNRLAEAVVRGLREGAGARDGAAAIVEPVSRDVPTGNVSHERPPIVMMII